ncbi:MAG: hypothetical protein WCI45_00175 [Desulfuromonadales bacterium]
MCPDNSFKSSDFPLSSNQKDAKIQLLESEVEVMRARVKELEYRIQDLTAKDVHNDKPRSPMCG